MAFGLPKKGNPPSVSGRVYANGKVGVFLVIDGDGENLSWICKNNNNDPVGEPYYQTYSAAVRFADSYEPPALPEKRIGNRTISEWKDFAKRDDCLDKMVPSDLREILQHVF